LSAILLKAFMATECSDTFQGKLYFHVTVQRNIFLFK